MGDQDVGGVTAVDGDPDVTMFGAQVFVAGEAGRAAAATDPRIDRNAAPDCRAFGRLAGSLDDAGDLVSQREGQSAVLGDVEPFVAAQRKIAVLQMQVRVADAATVHPQQNFAAVWRRQLGERFTQRLAVGDKRLAVEFGHRCFGLIVRRSPIMPDDGGPRRGPAPRRQSRPQECPRPAPSDRDLPPQSGSPRRTPSERRLWRSILRRCPKAAWVARSSSARSHGSGAARGTKRTSEDVTLGGGTKAAGFTSNRIRASQRHCARTESRP